MGLLEDVKEMFGVDGLYEVLEVRKDAKPSAIKSAYKKKSLLCHPDKADQDNKATFTRKFQILCKCYDILQDEEKRKVGA